MKTNYAKTKTFICVLTLGLLILFVVNSVSASKKYEFNKKISREVLENYLDRSMTVQSMLIGRGADFEDQLKMIKNTGVKFIGRAVCQWAGESTMLANFEKEKELIPRIHAVDPDIILQACIFEIISQSVDEVPIPDWCFKEMGMSVEKRNFSYNKMLYPSGQFVKHWNERSSVPDISQPETKLYFFYQAATYINMGIEAIHFGQVELMNKNDKDLDHYAGLLAKIRKYAKKHARRGMIICDAHVPGGGFLYKGNYLLMDFHSFPLRIKEVGDPEEAILEVGHSDALFLRSKGGKTYSGWTCESLPYLVEFDNFGVGNRPGQRATGSSIFAWGFDEITWYARQPKEYRDKWLQYAYDFIKNTDKNGWLEMPGGRQITQPSTGANTSRWYACNNPSQATPGGYGDEDLIRDIWNAGRTASR